MPDDLAMDNDLDLGDADEDEEALESDLLGSDLGLDSESEEL